MVATKKPQTKISYTFLIDRDLAEGLKKLKAETDVPESVSVRKAIRRYLEDKKVLAKPKVSKRKSAVGTRRSRKA